MNERRWSIWGIGTLLALLLAGMSIAQDDGNGGAADDDAPPREQDEDENGGDEPTEGDPVLQWNGAFMVRKSFMHIPGRGMDFDVRITHRSSMEHGSPVGKTWDCNWFQHIELNRVWSPIVLQPQWGAQEIPTDGTSQPDGNSSGISHVPGVQTPEAWEPTRFGEGEPTEVPGTLIMEGAYYDNGEGRHDRFEPQDFPLAPDGFVDWTPPAGLFVKTYSYGPPTFILGQFAPPARFVIRRGDGMILEFAERVDGTRFNSDITYWLSSLQDRMGNRFELEYETIEPSDEKRLVAVHDTLGRRIDFFYHNATGLLDRIVDFQGRELTFGHDNDGNLTQVTMPTIAGEGYRRRMTFDYDSAQHPNAVTAVTDGAEHRKAQLNGTTPIPYVQNSYDIQGRVYKQILGGTNDSGVHAGGTYRFYYEVVPDGGTRNWGSAAAGGVFKYERRVLRVDPNGNVKLNTFNQTSDHIFKHYFTGRLDPDLLPDSASPASLLSLNDLNPFDHNQSLNTQHAAYEQPLGSSTQPCYVVHQAFNDVGLMTALHKPGVTILRTYDDDGDVFARTNLLRMDQLELPDDQLHYPAQPATPRLSKIYAYEPLYNQVRAVIEQRWSAGEPAPDGDNGHENEYVWKYVFDYQERDLLNLPDGDPLEEMIDTWNIDLDQDSMFAALSGWFYDGLPRITDADALGDVNGDGLFGITGQHRGNAIVRDNPRVHAYVVDWDEFAIHDDNDTLFTYNDFSLLRTYTDSLGAVTRYDYHPESDPDGDGLDIDPDADHATGDLGGGFLQRVVTAVGLPEQTDLTYFYDPLGRQNKTVNARGYASHTVYNEMNEVVLTTNPRGYSARYTYDGNGNIIEDRLDNYAPTFDTLGYPVTPAQGQDPAEVEQDLGQVVNTYAYDLLNNLVQSTHQANRYAITPKVRYTTAQADSVTTRHRYDNNGNLVLTIMPRACAGESPHNVTSWIYDERNLVYASTQGGLHDSFDDITAHDRIDERFIGSTPDTATSFSVYNGTGLRIAMIDPDGDQYAWDYDGYTRQIRAYDPLLNYTETTWDAANNPVMVRTFQAGDETPLSEARSFYDQLGRVYLSQIRVLPAPPVGDSWASTYTQYDTKGRTVATIDDNGVATTFQYDALDRLTRRTDNVGNYVSHFYDDNGNRVRSESFDVWDIDGDDIADGQQGYLTERYYDELDRLVATMDTLGYVTRFAYDSRNRLAFQSDANATDTTLLPDTLDLAPALSEHTRPFPPGLTVNGHGNSVHFTYDDLARHTDTYMVLRGNGLGGNAIVGAIHTKTRYDDNGNVTAQIDDQDNTTAFAFDALDRLVTAAYADGTDVNLTYHPDSMLLRRTDANGTVVRHDYDPANRLTDRVVESFATGVIQWTRHEHFVHDGLNRITVAEDLGEFDQLRSRVTRTYDTRSRVLSETLQLGAVSATTTTVYDAIGNLLSCTSPGGRTITCRYDGLNRLQAIAENAADIAVYRYFGARVMQRQFPAISTNLDVGYDEVRRPTLWSYAAAAAPQWTIGWDRADNKASRSLVSGSDDVTFDYDSVNRMTSSTRTASGQTVAYDLDGVGNRQTVTGGPNAGDYTLDGDDHDVNQYSATPRDCRRYDDNGNLTGLNLPAQCDADPAQVRLGYDVNDRLVNVNLGPLVHRYQYDAFGRRIAKVVNEGLPSQRTTFFFYNNLQVCAEQENGNVVATYVYGLGLDSVLNMRRNGQDYYYLADDLGNVMEIRNAAGTPVERHDYADYGEVLHPDTKNPVPAGQLTPIGNPYMFAARRIDPETGFYYCRNRYLDPYAGRFINRDPIGIWGDPANSGNGYTYVASNPWSLVDPLGLYGDTEWAHSGGSFWGGRSGQIARTVGPARAISGSAFSSGGARRTSFFGAGVPGTASFSVNRGSGSFTVHDSRGGQIGTGSMNGDGTYSFSIGDASYRLDQNGNGAASFGDGSIAIIEGDTTTVFTPGIKIYKGGTFSDGTPMYRTTVGTVTEYKDGKPVSRREVDAREAKEFKDKWNDRMNPDPKKPEGSGSGSGSTGGTGGTSTGTGGSGGGSGGGDDDGASTNTDDGGNDGTAFCWGPDPPPDGGTCGTPGLPGDSKPASEPGDPGGCYLPAPHTGVPPVSSGSPGGGCTMPGGGGGGMPLGGASASTPRFGSSGANMMKGGGGSAAPRSPWIK